MMAIDRRREHLIPSTLGPVSAVPLTASAQSFVDGVRRALGRQVRKLRTAQGLSQEQLGERADLHWTHISGIERAQYDLKLSTLTRVSRGLGVSLAALFAGIVAPRARRKRSPSVATGVRSSHRARR